MGEAVRRRHHARGAVLAPDLGRRLRGEIALQRRDSAAGGDLADLGRLDAENAVALEIRKQRPVVRADIDDEVLRPELQHCRRLRIEFGKIVPQQLGGAAGVGIFGRKDDDGIDRQAELHQVALAAVQEVGWKPRLLPRDCADRHHLVHRRHVAEREHVGQRRMSADLTAFDRNACSGAGGTGDFCWKQCHLLATAGLRRRRHALVIPVPFERRRQSLVERNTRGL